MKFSGISGKLSVSVFIVYVFFSPLDSIVPLSASVGSVVLKNITGEFEFLSWFKLIIVSVINVQKKQ